MEQPATAGGVRAPQDPQWVISMDESPLKLFIKAALVWAIDFEEPVKTYSAGMRARRGFTTALMTHVDILLLDEVLSVGDAQFRAKAESTMKERIGGEQTVVFVSHNDSQVKNLCDRAIWLHKGSLGAEGEVSEVMSAYRKS